MHKTRALCVTERLCIIHECQKRSGFDTAAATSSNQTARAARLECDDLTTAIRMRCGITCCNMLPVCWTGTTTSICSNYNTCTHTHTHCIAEQFQVIPHMMDTHLPHLRFPHRSQTALLQLLCVRSIRSKLNSLKVCNAICY